MKNFFPDLKLDQATFESMPNEIIHRVLKLLDGNSLKSVALVNRRFADMISNSTILMRNFNLVLSSIVWQSKSKIDEVFSLQRSFQQLEISSFHNRRGLFPNDVLIKLFKKLGCNIKSLSLSKSKFDDFTLREILKNTDSLEILKFSEIEIVKKLPPFDPVNLRKLKNLKLYNCNWSIVKFISAQVTSLNIKNYLDEGKCKKNLVNFLILQRKLHDITLSGTSARTLFTSTELITNCPFVLTKFHLENGFGKNSDRVNWNLTAFLSLHSKSLREVEISGPNCAHMNGFVITNLDSLTSLSIDVRGLPKNQEFYEIVDQEQNYQLKELILCGFFAQKDSIRRILMKYPEIEKLELNDWSNSVDLVDFVSTRFPKLKKLSVNEISGGENAKFGALKNLTVSYIRNSSKLLQFITQNPSINTIKVGLICIGSVAKDFIDDLKYLENLEHLTFAGSGEALRWIPNLMDTKKRPKSLKTLELLPITDSENSNRRKPTKYYFSSTRPSQLNRSILICKNIE